MRLAIIVFFVVLGLNNFILSSQYFMKDNVDYYFKTTLLGIICWAFAAIYHHITKPHINIKF